ncbi:hypothetical protein GALL_508470 [mine drainage metagenome]|uniref:Uncharacterized protein n=1 Tax=mine drainage metagenome TaxID=410659 RepID=A0A1J5PVF9_9ZZZZ
MVEIEQSHGQRLPLPLCARSRPGELGIESAPVEGTGERVLLQLLADLFEFALQGANALLGGLRLTLCVSQMGAQFTAALLHGTAVVEHVPHQQTNFVPLAAGLQLLQPRFHALVVFATRGGVVAQLAHQQFDQRLGRAVRLAFALAQHAVAHEQVAHVVLRLLDLLQRQRRLQLLADGAGLHPHPGLRHQCAQMAEHQPQQVGQAVLHRIVVGSGTIERKPEITRPRRQIGGHLRRALGCDDQLLHLLPACILLAERAYAMLDGLHPQLAPAG